MQIQNIGTEIPIVQFLRLNNLWMMSIPDLLINYSVAVL